MHFLKNTYILTLHYSETSNFHCVNTDLVLLIPAHVQFRNIR